MHLKIFIIFYTFSKDKFETPSKLKVIIFSVLEYFEIFSKLRPFLLLIKKKCIKNLKLKQ